MLDAIEKSKSNSLERLLFGLGITHVGEKTAKILANNYKTLDNLMNATEEDLVSIPDIGDIIADSIIKYFKNEDNCGIIKQLKNLNINTTFLGK